MSLLQPLVTFQTGTYTVTRKAPGTRVDGLWVDGATTTHDSIGMVVTPPPGQVLKTLPEGTVSEDVRSIRCAFDLRVQDLVNIDGDDFAVYTRRRWTVRGVSYTWAVAIRAEQGTVATATSTGAGASGGSGAAAGSGA